jgi:hypothetical protein
VNTCFISYRHLGDPDAAAIVTAFKKALVTQISLWIPNASVYFDTERLQGGDFFSRELARQLCRSSCMILLFNPFYFDVDHPYCAREYKAMLHLERDRLAKLPRELQSSGLIIPVIIRGEESLPNELKTQRQYFSLDQYLLQPADFQQRECLAEIRKIANVVYHRYRLMSRFGADATDCSAFDFPSEDDIREWLHQIVDDQPNPRMPGW